jgi:hypothetical protein
MFTDENMNILSTEAYLAFKAIRRSQWYPKYNDK